MFFTQFLYNALLLNSFIPISLYVSMNFVRFLQAWFMNQVLVLATTLRGACWGQEWGICCRRCSHLPPSPALTRPSTTEIKFEKTVGTKRDFFFRCQIRTSTCTMPSPTRRLGSEP